MATKPTPEQTVQRLLRDLEEAVERLPFAAMAERVRAREGLAAFSRHLTTCEMAK